MERKTTKFTILLLITALFFGLSTYAQKTEPVKANPGKAATGQVTPYTGAANWQLEQELQSILEGKASDAKSAKPKPTPEQMEEYAAQKAVYVEKTEEEALRSQHSDGMAPKLKYPPASTAPSAPNPKYPTTEAYAYNAYDPTSVYPLGPIQFVLNTPGSILSIANQATLDWVAGASWANGEWYGATYSASNNSQFIKLNTTTGARTVINAGMGIGISAMAFDWTTYTMYAVNYNSTTASSALYTVNLTTGVPTLVGTIGAAIYINLACDQNGQLFSVNINLDQLYSINKNTGAPTLVGAIGWNANYAQDMEFDNSDNTCYMAAYSLGTPYGGQLRTINLSNATNTLVGGFPGQMEVTGFAIPNLPFITYPNDLGITTLVGPPNGMGLGANEVIEVNVRNFGLNDQVNFPIRYILDGGTPVVEICTTTVPAGAVVPYAFTTPADLSGWGDHSLNICTQLPGDQQPINDCKNFTVTKIMPTWTDTIYPNPLPYWTGTTNGSSFIENSLIKVKSGSGTPLEAGWAKFDISMLPENTPISALKLGYYTQSQSGAPYFQLTRCAIDPMANSPSAVLTAISSGTQYFQTTAGYAVGWHVFDLPQQARTDLSAATAVDWYAVGWKEYENCSGCYYMTIAGWNEGYQRPYLVVTYGYIPGPNDMGITALASPVSAPNMTNAELVTVTVQNYGSADQTNVPVSYQVTGSPVVNEIIPGLFAAGSSQSYTFTQTANMLAYGTYALHVCTDLVGDNFPNNDCKNYFITNSIPTVTDTLWPQNLPYWTGSTNGTSFFEQSLIKIRSGSTAAPLEAGWAKFDLSDVPEGVTFLSANLNYYMSFQSGAPYFRMNALLNDPMIGTPATVMSQIVGGTTYISTTAGYSVGWHAFALPALALTHLSTQTQYDWFAIGFHEYENCNNCYYGTMHGWAETNTPYIIVNYQVPLAHDVEVLSIDTDPFIVTGPYDLKATVRNKGLNTETFDVQCTASGGFTNTQTVTLAVGQSAQVTFPGWIAPVGVAAIQVCTQLGNDMNINNNCKSKNLSVEAKLTTTYAYNAYDPSAQLGEGPVRFYLEHPETILPLAPSVSTEFISAGCWANGVWYGTEYSYANNSNLWTLNPTTGAMTLIGPMGANFSGMSYDHTTGIMYGVAAYQDALGVWNTDLYTINMTTGAATPLNPIGPIGLAINLACSQTGMLFFAEITNDRIWNYDPTTDVFELMGPVGQALNYAQDAEFDKEINQLYFAGYTSTGTLFRCDISTGQLTPIATFQGGAEITGMAIPYTWTPEEVDLGIMWITNPTIGNLTTEEPVVIRLRNYGTTTVTDLDMHFVYNGDTTTEFWSTWSLPPIDPGVYFDYGFIPVLDLSASGQHCIKAWIDNVEPATDENQYNDTVRKCVTNVACGQITCFTNSIQEPEPCGDDVNGGCFSTNPAYTNLFNGDTYCGSLWKVDTLLDYDWYLFNLASVKAINVHAKAEYNLDITLVKLPCTNLQVIATKTINKCTLDSFFVNALQPGQYALIFNHNPLDFNTFCNNFNKYTFDFLIVPAKYCAAGASICDEYISNVQVGTINNPTGCTSGGYANYTALSTTMNVGTGYPITVSNGYGWSGDQCGIWVDWNQDLDFNDINEKILPVGGSPGYGPYTATITPPADALPGPTVMRVRITYVGNVEPCGTTTWGEVEDYSVFVNAPVPPIVTTIGSLNEACPGTKVIPIDVELFNNVNSMNLVLGVGAGLTYLGYQNVNSALATGAVTVTPTGNNLQVNWFSLTPATIGEGLLMELVFATTAGTHNLVWDLGPDGCQYTNLTTGVIPSTWVDGQLVFGNCSDLEGFVKYKNPQLSIFTQNVEVYLYNGPTVAYTTTLDPVDHKYKFTALANGTYTLTANTTTPWGGCNANDALAILRHFVNIPPLLSGLNVRAADVNGSGGIPNAADALAVSRRFVGQITNFMPPNVNPPGGPDWYFENLTIIVDGTANQAQNIMGLCAGDVATTFYIPPNSIPSAPAMVSPGVYLKTEGLQYVDNSIAEVPVYVENAMKVGAVSLVLNFDPSLDIVDVIVPNTADNLAFTANSGQLRLSWFTLDAVELNAGDVLLTLKVKAHNLSRDITFSTTSESILGTEDADVIENASLLMPKLSSLSNAAEYSLSNFPNPFNTTTEIRYSIPQSGQVSLKVYNVLGEVVAEVVNAEQKAGNYTVSFDGSKLPKGVYVYKLQVNDVTRANSMVITE